ncbi:MAG: hypothetical protein RIS70_717 [Planctomycetota bacterium]
MYSNTISQSRSQRAVRALRAVLSRRIPERVFTFGLHCAFAYGLSAALLGMPTQAQDDPFAPAAGTPKARSTAKTPTLPDRVEEKDAAVLGLRQSNLSTPQQWTNAVKVTLDIGRPDEASTYLQKLIDAKLDDNTLAALRAKFGSDFFLRLSRAEKLSAEERAFGTTVLEASQRVAQDPARLAALIPQLAAPGVEARAAAVGSIALAGRMAVNPLLQVLRDPAQAELHPAIRQMLVKLGRDAVDPLLAAMQSEEPELRVQLYEVVSRLQSERAVGYLLRPALSDAANNTGDPQRDISDTERTAASEAVIRIVGERPSRVDAEQFLLRRVHKLLAGEQTTALDNEGYGEIWLPDPETKLPIAKRFDALTIAAIEAERVASELHRFVPENKQYRRLYLAARLEVAQLEAGLDSELPDDSPAIREASAEGPSVLEEVLEFCLRQNRVAGALATLRAISIGGAVDLLHTEDGRPGTLAASLQHSDRRVRFAATQAVLAIDPQTAFPGASLLTDVLGFSASSVGARRALVVHPQAAEAQNLVGMLNSRGYEADPASNGRTAFVQARRQSDYEFVLVSHVLEHPRVFEFIEALRQDPLTARLPVLIIVRADEIDKARRSSDLDAHTMLFVRPYDSEALDLMLHRIAGMSRRSVVSRDERIKHAEASLSAISRLHKQDGKYRFYDLPRLENSVLLALQTMELSQPAAEVLGQFGTPRAQQALADFASEPSRPLAARQKSVLALGEAIQHHGILLTKDSILAQYSRYNASERLDADSQKVLSDILDLFEQHAAVADGKKSESATIPADSTDANGSATPDTPAAP